jgi:sodium/bile acid cotransporter 7
VQHVHSVPDPGVLFAWWAPVNVDPALYTGFLYLCILPATVQSAIAFTSLAGGNVAAAVCSASASSLLGILFPAAGGPADEHARRGRQPGAGRQNLLQLLLPFVLGIFRVRGWGFVAKHKKWISKPTRPRFCWWSIPPSAKRW